MNNAFSQFRNSVEMLFSDERDNLLDNILSDFMSESKDTQSISILEKIVECYRNGNTAKKIATTAETIVASGDDDEFEPRSPSGPVCMAVFKTGSRKGQNCQGKVVAEGMCKRHQSKPSASPLNPLDEKCPATMKAGVRKGQVCGCAVPNGEMYCGKHKMTKCIHKLKNGECCGRQISLHSPSESYCRIHVKIELSLDVKKLITMLNKFGMMEHKYSGLVFENKKVVGSQCQNGSVNRNLSYDDFECIIAYGLPFDPVFKEQFDEYLKVKSEK